MPKIALELTLGRRRTLERRKGTLLFCNVNARILSRKLDVLKDFAVESACLLRGPRNTKLGKHIRKTLNANANGTMASIGITALLRGLLIEINDLIQVVRENRSHLTKSLEVEGPTLHETRQAQRTQIADGCLVGRRVLNDFGTEITGLDRSKMLLIGLAVRCVLLQELRTPRLDLRVQDHLPNLLGRKGLATAILLLVLQIELLEF